MGKSDREKRGVIQVQNINRLKAFIFLSIGIALLAYSLLAVNSFNISARAVLMMGSVMQPGGSAASDRIIVAIFLLLLFITGLGLVGVSVKTLMDSRRK
jgi:hypothetical protein